MDERPSPAWAGRLHFLQSSLATCGLDAFVVSTPTNLTYLTGFAGSAGLLVITPDTNCLVVDGRYDFAVREAIRTGAVARVSVDRVEKRYDLTLAAFVTEHRLHRVGFESAHVTVATLGGWQRAAPGVEWVAVDRLVEKQRIIKDDGELAVLRRGSRTIARVAERLGHLVARGRSEREIAEAIDDALIDAGFERTAFPTIVASGPNSAYPHARPTDRRLVSGDLVVLDFGGVLDGYCVDLTRMAAVSPLTSKASALYDGVLAANLAAIAAVRPGIATSAVDEAARNELEARGLGEAFLHATGHGLGLDVHEAPRIARADPEAVELVEAGMVFTIEPGAYVEGVGGVRLEDDVLVTTDGCEVLTDIPRDLLVV